MRLNFLVGVKANAVQPGWVVSYLYGTVQEEYCTGTVHQLELNQWVTVTVQQCSTADSLPGPLSLL